MQEHIFTDFSLTTLKFPDFSRFSRWVPILLVKLYIDVKMTIYFFTEGEQHYVELIEQCN